MYAPLGHFPSENSEVSFCYGRKNRKPIAVGIEQGEQAKQMIEQNQKKEGLENLLELRVYLW